jgi:hypothetical protein
MVHFMAKQGMRAYNVNSHHKPQRMSVSDDDNFMISLQHRHTLSRFMNNFACGDDGRKIGRREMSDNFIHSLSYRTTHRIDNENLSWPEEVFAYSRQCYIW